MNYKTFEIDFIKVCRDSQVISSDACRFIDHFFSNNGYIAGGFARKIASTILFDKFSKEDKYNIYFYLKSMTGDIDVFFKTKEDALKVQPSITENQICPFYRDYTNTKAHFGYQFRTQNNEMFQTIVKVHGNPEQVVSTFDIANAKIFIDSNGIHYTDEWLELENNKTIGIDLWDKSNLLWRVHKWFVKHDYKSLRENDVEKYVDCLYSITEKVKNKGLVRWDRPVTNLEIQKFVKKFCNFNDVSMNDVLKASLLLDSYSQMNILNSMSTKI